MDFNNDIIKCLDVINKGGTILYPTDTVWGIGCDATNSEAIDKVFEVKQRPKEKSLIVLLAEPKDILQYIAAPPPDIISIIESFERPTTVIYSGAIDFADNAIHPDGSIAIRVVNDPFCKALIKRMRRPLVSTSANVSGRPTPQTFGEIEEIIRSNVDYVVQYRQDDTTMHQPSRLVKIDEEGNMEILRP
jgi:L-threonylcarbamoyladenylate synthase